jgi:hypothetical protein
MKQIQAIQLTNCDERCYLPWAQSIRHRTVSTQATEPPSKQQRIDRPLSNGNKAQDDITHQPVSSAERTHFPLISGSPVCSSSSDSREKALELGRQSKLGQIAAIRARFEAKVDVLESQ